MLNGGKIKTIPPFLTDPSQVGPGVITEAAIYVTDLSAISANMGTITAGSITGITITGGTITGAQIETAATGQRIVLNESDNTLRVFDSSNNEVLDIFGEISSIAVLEIQPAATDMQAIFIEMPASSTTYGVSISSSSNAATLFLETNGSGAALGIVAGSNDLTTPMISVSAGSWEKNIMQLYSTYTGSLGNIMLDLQKVGGGYGKPFNINNQGLDDTIYITVGNASNSSDVIYISASHAGRIMEIDQSNVSNPNNVLYITTANATVAPIYSGGGIVDVHFARCIATPGGAVIWGSDGTNPSGTLSANAGDICLNGGSGIPYYCTGGTSWTAF